MNAKARNVDSLTESLLKDSELRYRRLFEAAQDGILILDAETGAIEDVNPYLIDILGYSRAEFEKKKLWEVGAFKDAAASKIAFHILQENGYIRYDNLPLMAKGERLIEVEFVSNVYEVGARKVIQCNIRNITERLRVEKEIQQRDKRFRALIENSTDAITLLDAEGKVIYDSPAAPGMLGHGPEDWISENVFKLMHPDDLRKNEDLFRILLGKPGEHVESAFRVQHKNGSWLWIEVIATNLLREPSVNAIVLNYRDITRRVKVEESLRTSNERLQLALAATRTGVWEWHVKNNEVYWSPECYDILGTDTMEKTFEAFLKLIHPDDVDRVNGDIQRSISQKTQFSVEFRILNRLGKVLWLQNVGKAQYDENGNPTRMVGTVGDITERRRTADEIKVLEKFSDENPFPVLRLNDKGVILYANSAAQEVLEDWNEVIGQEAPPFWLQKVTEVLANQSKQIVDISIGTKAFSFIIAPIIDAGYVNLYGIDVTERKQNEKDLQELKQKNEEALHIAGMGYWDFDYLTGLFTLNDQYFRLHGTTAEAAGGYQMSAEKFVSRYLNPDDAHVVGEAIEAARESNDPHFNFHRDTRVLRADGEQRVFSVWFRVEKDPQGRTTRLVGVNQDITERKRAEERNRRQLQQLAALRNIDEVIISSSDLRISLTMILGEVTRELGMDAADVLLLNSNNLFLEYSVGTGFRTRAAEKVRVRLGQGLAGRVALDRQPIEFLDLKAQPADSIFNTQLAEEDFKCYFGVPLVAKGIVRGVLEVYHRAPVQPDQEWLEFLNTLADQAALAIDNVNLVDTLQRSNIDLTLAYDATIEGWSRAMDLRDKETEGHTRRVTEITMKMAGFFRIQDEELVDIRRGAMLHDIGKMGVPDAIMLKPGPLTDEEWVNMRKHPTLAFKMLSPINYLKSAIDIPYCHHEKWDGTGYPRGLKGDQIPLPARIFAVVDVWDAITSHRPYRAAWSKEKALEYLKSESGKQFDPEVLKICLDSGIFV